MQNPVVPAAQTQQALVPAEVVKANIQTVLRQHPDLVSYDPTTDEGEMIGLRVLLDPGIPAQHRDKWRGTIVNWGIAPVEIEDQKTGQIDTVPSLALFAEDGEIVRLTGWPAIKSWAKLVEAAGKERCQLGIKVKIIRHPSQTAGRAYWLVLPDA